MIDDAAPLGPEDAQDCAALATRVGWAHTPFDWTIRLGRGTAWGIRREGALIALAMVYAYPPRFGFLGNLAVDPDHQRKGLGEALTRLVIAHFAGLGLPIHLFSSEMGARLYGRFGFHDVGAVAGYGIEVPAASGDLPPPGFDRDGAFALDAQVYGADRADMIAPYLDAGLALAVGGAQGYALATSRQDATIIGPLIAGDTGRALALVDELLPRLSGPVRLNVPEGRSDLIAGLEARGFHFRRRLPLMARGEGEGWRFGDASRFFAIFSGSAG